MIKLRYKELSRNTILFLVNNLGNKIIYFFLVPIYTRALTPAEYGMLDLLNTTILLLIPVLTINIQDAVLRFALDNGYDLKKVLADGAFVVLIGFFLLTTVTLLIKTIGLLVVGWEYILFFLSAYFLRALQNVFTMYLKAIDNVSIIVISSLASAFLTCALSIVFLFGYKMGIEGYLLANIIALAAGVNICFWGGRLHKIKLFIVDIYILRGMISYSFPLVVNSIAWWVNDFSDRYILTAFWGSSINGIYAVSYKIPAVIISIQGIFYNAWSISAIKEYKETDSDKFMTIVYTIYNFSNLLICSCILVFNKVISRLLYAKEFYDAWKYTPLLVVGAYFYGLALFEGCIFSAAKRTKDVSLTTLVGAISNIILNLFLIPWIGAFGAALATFCGYTLTWFVRSKKLAGIANIKVAQWDNLICYILISILAFLAMLEKTGVFQVLVMMVVVVIQVKKIVTMEKNND